MLGAAVPETPVHENREFNFLKNEIRFAEDFLIPTPAGDLVLPEKCCERDFCVLVPASANQTHYFRTLRFGENVKILFCRSSFHLHQE